MRHYERTTEPAMDPITVDEVKSAGRIDHETEDGLLAMYVTAATEACEKYLGRALISQTWTLYYDEWPNNDEPWWDGVRVASQNVLSSQADVIELPYGPLLSVTSISTFNTSDTETAVSTDVYGVSTGIASRVYLKDGQVWPSATRTRDGVKIVYVAGYGTDFNDVPMAIRQGIIQLCVHWYENREATVDVNVNKVPNMIRKIWSPHKAIR
jgi:hypothetical protein